MFRNSGSLFAQSSMSCETSRWSCFCSIVRSFGTNFADTLRMAKTSVKTECTEPVLISISSASSRTVTRRFYMTKVRTWSMSSSLRLVEGLPERASLSTDVRPSLNRMYHSLICVMPMASSPKTSWVFRMVSLACRQDSGKIWFNTAARVVPSLSRKITLRRALSVHWHSHAGCTRLTLSVGGKISTHAHESTLHLHTTAHLPLFISFRGKNHVGYSLNRPRTLLWDVVCENIVGVVAQAFVVAVVKFQDFVLHTRGPRSVITCQSTRRHIPEDGYVRRHCP